MDLHSPIMKKAGSGNEQSFGQIFKFERLRIFHKFPTIFGGINQYLLKSNQLSESFSTSQ